MVKLRSEETEQSLPFARAVDGEDFTRCDADTNGVGIVACTGYFCRGRTFRFLELQEIR